MLYRVDTRTMQKIDSADIGGSLSDLTCSDAGLPICILTNGSVIMADFRGQRDTIWKAENGRCVDAVIWHDSTLMLLGNGGLHVRAVDGTGGRQIRESDFGIYDELFITAERVIIHRLAGSTSELLVGRIAGAWAHERTISMQVIIEALLRDEGSMIVVDAGGRLSWVDLNEGTSGPCVFDRSYYFSNTLIMSSCRIGERTYGYGPRSTIASSQNGRVFMLRSALDLSSKRAGSIVSAHASGVDELAMSTSAGRVFASSDGGRTWLNHIVIGDTISGGIIAKLVRLWGETYGLYSGNDNVPMIMRFGRFGTYDFSGYRVVSPIAVFELDDSRALAATAFGMFDVDRAGAVASRGQLFFLPAEMKCAIMSEPGVVMYGGRVPRAKDSACVRSLFKGVICRVNVQISGSWTRSSWMS
jgi:hypothetical protein